MKNLVIGLFALIASFTVFAEPTNSSFNGDGTVKIRYQKFIFVKNVQGSAVTEGQVLCVDTTEDDGISASYCSATGDPALCMVAEASCADDAMCKCQTEGYTDDFVFNGSGDNAVAGKSAFAHTGGQGAARTTELVSDHAVGVFLDAASTSIDVEVYLNF